MHVFALFAVASAAVVSAQTASQNATASALAAQIPACALPCDEAGIRSVGCGLTDYACHCAHSTQLSAIIPPCLKQNSTCSSSDLSLFASIPPKICAALNSTTPAGTGTAVSVGPTGSVGVNSTLITTATAAGGTSTGGSTVSVTTTGSGSATAVPPSPSSASSALPSSTNAAALSHVGSGLFAVIGVGMLSFGL